MGSFNYNKDDIIRIIDKACSEHKVVILCNEGFVILPRYIENKGKIKLIVSDSSIRGIIEKYKGVAIESIKDSKFSAWMNRIGKVLNTVREKHKCKIMAETPVMRMTQEVEIQQYKVDIITNIRAVIKKGNEEVLFVYNVKSVQDILEKVKGDRSLGILKVSYINMHQCNDIMIINNLIYNNKVVGKRLEIKGVGVFNINTREWVKMNKVEKCSKLAERIRGCRLMRVQNESRGGAKLISSIELRHGEYPYIRVVGV